MAIFGFYGFIISKIYLSNIYSILNLHLFQPHYFEGVSSFHLSSYLFTTLLLIATVPGRLYVYSGTPRILIFTTPPSCYCTSIIRVNTNDQRISSTALQYLQTVQDNTRYNKIRTTYMYESHIIVRQYPPERCQMTIFL